MAEQSKPIVIVAEKYRLEMIEHCEYEAARNQVLGDAILAAVSARMEFNRNVKAFWVKIKAEYTLADDPIYTFNEKTGEIFLSPQNKPVEKTQGQK